MAGNKAIFDTAMKRAHEYAWANQWERAIKEYGRALSEVPDDRTAQRNMAQCLFRLRRWPEALAAYEKLIKQDANDLFALNRLAETYLALGQLEGAQVAYFRLIDLYMQGNQVLEAIRALRDFSKAVPGNKEIHLRLLELTQQVGDRQAQAQEHVALSQIALEESKLGEAQQYAEAASALDPENAEIRRWGYAVRRRLAQAAGTVSLAPDADFDRQVMMPGTGLLVREEVEPAEAIAFVEQATQAQNMGEFRQALDLYDQAVRAGAQRASVFYSAGLLNQQMGRAEVAIPFLERAAQEPEFAVSANYVMGQCYQALKNYPKAIVAFERALNQIELSKLTRTEADELIELYSATADANLADNNPGRASSLYTNLVKLFKEHKWAHPQLADLEKKADELYNKSIQSKLLGISGRSGDLNPSTLPESLPQPIEATRIMLEDSLAENGNGSADLPSPTVIISDETTPRPAAMRADIATTVMRAPGKTLRSITEYLRAAQPSDMSEPPAQESALPSLVEGTATLEGTTGLTSALPVHFSPDQHAIVDLPAPVLAGMEQQSLAVQRLLAEAEQAVSRSEWIVAIDTCMAIIGAEPGYLPIHIMLGDIYLHRGKVEDAIAKYQTIMDAFMVRRDLDNATEACRRLLILDPDNPALRMRLGSLLLEAGKPDEAARVLLAIVEKYYQAGNVAQALQEARTLKVSLPNSSEVALAIGTYELAWGQHKEALTELSRALHLDPANDTALARLYSVLAIDNEATQWDALQSMIERAGQDQADSRLFMEELHAAIQRKPAPGLYYGLAVLAEQAGLTDIASDALDQGTLQLSLSEAAETDQPWVLLEALMRQFRGDLALTQKDGAVAAQNYSRVLELINPQSEGQPRLQSSRSQYGFARLADPTQLYYGMAEAYASQNNWEGALEALQALKKLMPGDTSVYTRLADIYFRQGQLSQALTELNELLVLFQKNNDHEKTLETLGHMAKLAPNNIAVRRKLSDMYLKLGMTEYGMNELNTLAELQLKAGLLKDAMLTYQKAADLHYTLGQHDKAIAIYERIVRIAPRDIEARHQLLNMYVQSGKIKEAIEGERTLADVFVHEGRIEEAIAALHQLLALAPEDVEAHHLLAKQLTAIGEYGQAARLYARLTRLEPENDSIPILQSEMERMAKERGDSDSERASARKNKAEAKGQPKRAPAAAR